MSVAVVTDSSASLPPEVADDADVVVVPLQVVIGPDSYDETSDDLTPELLATALQAFRPISTSRPAPQRFIELFERLAAEGASGIVSVHLSGEMSGTLESAQLAARAVDVEVVAVDSRQVGVATGYAALAAAQAAAGGASVAEAAAAARACAESATSLFYVDTLEYLRRGGRIGAAAKLIGGALAVKPLLTIEDGSVRTLEKVRTANRALARLEELAVEAAGDQAVDVCVGHLASPERAGQLAEHLRERLGDQLSERGVWCHEIGAALGAHVGPGMVSVCVSPV